MAGVSWARDLLPLKTRRVDEDIPPADVVVRKEGFQLRCPRHSTKAQNYKSLVYADKPQTLDHLEDNICRVIADIRSQMLEKVIENWTSRLDYIRASRGSSVPEIICKM
ncbi:hypothetical protein TNCV_1690861 [Trichonephila clavipes]|nr:hypothetical protein TNCV_1690861 [Trichonephila clavipes]